MKNQKSKLLFTGLVAALLASRAFAQFNANVPAPESSLVFDQRLDGAGRTSMALVRSNLQNEKAFIVADNLPLTDAEADGFWPLHREYEMDLNRLNDQKLALMERYAKKYEVITNKDAAELAKGHFDLEVKTIDLKRQYFDKFSKVMPVTKVMRFFQIETRLNLAVDLQVHASMPLTKD
jgi:hypothetical protein